MARKPNKARPSEDENSRKGRKPKANEPAPETKRPRGRPSIYTQELADEICRRLAEGESLFRICKDEHMPAKSTVLQWALNDTQGFYARYAHAREIQLGVREDEIIDISDDGTNDFMEREQKNGEKKIIFSRDQVERSKLRVETRKWLLTKLRPDKYGEKIEQTHKGDAAFLALWQKMGERQS
jgi:hypothetical protein